MLVPSVQLTIVSAANKYGFKCVLIVIGCLLIRAVKRISTVHGYDYESPARSGGGRSSRIDENALSMGGLSLYAASAMPAGTSRKS